MIFLRIAITLLVIFISIDALDNVLRAYPEKKICLKDFATYILLITIVIGYSCIPGVNFVVFMSLLLGYRSIVDWITDEIKKR